MNKKKVDISARPIWRRMPYIQNVHRFRRSVIIDVIIAHSCVHTFTYLHFFLLLQFRKLPSRYQVLRHPTVNIPIISLEMTFCAIVVERTLRYDEHPRGFSLANRSLTYKHYLHVHLVSNSREATTLVCCDLYALTISCNTPCVFWCTASLHLFFCARLPFLDFVTKTGCVYIKFMQSFHSSN